MRQQSVQSLGLPRISLDYHTHQKGGLLNLGTCLSSFLLLVALQFLFAPATVHAESGTQIVDVSVTHIFGDQINLQATVESDEQIQKLEVVFQSADGFIIKAEPISQSPEGKIDYTLDIEAHPVRAFTNISIWFEIELEDGTTLTSGTTEYFYSDNRFEWWDIQSDDFTVYWYQDDPELGSRILNAAYDGVTRIQSWLDAPIPVGIDIYAYASAADMQQTLMFSGGSSFWVAGHADSTLGVIVISLPPGAEQILEIQRQIPHELVHIMLNRKMGPSYTYLPRWLNEGLASAAELLPNPDYQLLLDKAYDREALIPIRDLCSSFPIDAANFQLAYAESYAFTWYLQQTHGSEKIEELIQAYANGLNCEKGIEDTYETSLSELQAEWRQAMFNEHQVLNTWSESLPMVILAGFAVISPIGMMVFGIGRRHRPQGDKAIKNG